MEFHVWEKKMYKVNEEHLVISESKETIKDLAIVLRRFKSQLEELSLAKDKPIWESKRLTVNRLKYIREINMHDL